MLGKLVKDKGLFLSLRLLNTNKELLSDNFYWLPDSTGNYSGLEQMKKAAVNITVNKTGKGKIEVTIRNAKHNPVAFFNRLSLVNAVTKERILPAFYSDNYISILPGDQKKIEINFTPVANEKAAVELYGWNVAQQYIEIK